MKALYTIIIPFLLFFACASEIQKETEPNNVTKSPNFGSVIDSVSKDEYKTVQIGNVVWMAENLKTSVFANGDPIPESKNRQEWEDAKISKKASWCYLNFDPENGKKYGKIYNRYALTDSRGIAPAGWRVGSFSEWEALRLSCLQNTTSLRTKDGWKIWPTPSTVKKVQADCNSSGFSALAGGYSDPDGVFGKEEIETAWWAVTSKVNPAELNFPPAVTQMMRDESGIHGDTTRYDEYGAVCRNKCNGTVGIYGRARMFVDRDNSTIFSILPNKMTYIMSNAYIRCVRK